MDEDRQISESKVPPSIKKWVARLTPFVWAPIIPLLPMSTGFGFVSVSGSLLLIPLAVYLAVAHGRLGWWIVAALGASFVFQADENVGIYLVALLVSAWSISEDPQDRIARLPSKLSLRVVAGLLLLPIAVGLGHFPLGTTDVHLGFNPYPLFLLLVLILGAGGAMARSVLPALAIVAAIGAIPGALSLPEDAAELFGASLGELPVFGLVPLRSLYLHPLFDTPADLVTAAIYFFVGRDLSRLHKSDARRLPAMPSRLAIVVALGVFALGGDLDDYFISTEGLGSSLIGSYYALPIVALYAGLYFRFGGIVALCLLATAFVLVDGAIRANLAGDPDIRPVIRGETFLTFAAFGMLGIRLRDYLFGTETQLWSWAWAKFLGFYLLTLIAIIPLSERIDPILILAAFFGGIAVVMGFKDVLRRRWNFSITLEGGWLALASVMMAGYLAYNFSADILSTFEQISGLFGQSILIGEAMDEDVFTLAIVIAIGCILLWTVTSSLENLSASATDAWRKYQTFRERRRLDVSISLGSSPSVEAPNGAESMSTLRAMTWFNRALIVAAVAAPLALLGTNLLLEVREDQLRDRAEIGSVLGGSFGDLGDAESERRRLEEERRRQQEAEDAEFIQAVTRAAEGVLKDFPDVVSGESWLGRSIKTGWRPDDANPDIRWRATVDVSAPRNWRDLSVEDAAQRSVNIRARMQYRGLFGVWLEDPHGVDSFGEEQRRASELEDAIAKAAASALLSP